MRNAMTNLCGHSDGKGQSFAGAHEEKIRERERERRGLLWFYFFFHNKEHYVITGKALAIYLLVILSSMTAVL